MAIQESHVHYAIIVLLGISIILLGVHIGQMKKKERFATGPGNIITLAGLGAVGGQAQPLQDYITGASTTVTDPLNNPMVGPSNTLESTEVSRSNDDYYM
jgi:hypothetical protein